MHNLALEQGRMRDPAIAGLVEVLRQIHAARTNGAAGAPTSTSGLQPANGHASANGTPERQEGPTNGTPERGGAPALDLSGLAAALGELSARATRLHVPPRPEEQRASFYEALQERIRTAEAAALEQHTAIDRMLDRAGNGGADVSARTALVQETVWLQCARGGRTAGRFRCINRADGAVRAQIRPGATTVPGGGRIEGAAITVSPQECTLGPGAAAIITVAIDLQGCPTVAGDRIESCVDVELEGGASALRAWIAVDLYDAAP